MNLNIKHLRGTHRGSFFRGGDHVRKLKKYKPTRFMAEDSHYDKSEADFAVNFIENLCHTKGTWARKKFLLMDWQEQIIRDVFGTIKPNGYRQFNMAYVEIPKKNGKSELAAAVALLQTKKIKCIFSCIFKAFPFCFVRFYALFACLLYFLVSI